MPLGSALVKPLRVAMWSGPRNISTALLRSWENRADTAVVDEPLYASYLQATGKEHPGADQVIAHGETDWRKVVHFLTSDAPGGQPIFYQKQMTHHLLPEMEQDWLLGLTNCFLIRDPAAVIVSYAKKHDQITAEDLGFPQQAEIFEFVRARLGALPVVVDAQDFLRDPERMLHLLCARLAIAFDPAMLSWPPGLRESDGIWARHWYGEVAQSTGFQPYREGALQVPDRLREIEARCRRSYEELYPHRLR